jgi:PKD repeat protein
MIKNYKIALLFTLLGYTIFLLTGCDRDEDLGPLPVVDFTVDRTFAEIAEIINFANASNIENGSALTYEWDFGDGTKSTNRAPAKAYSATGKFPVTLTAISADGQRVAKTDTITIGRRFLTSILIPQALLTKPNPSTQDGLPRIPWDEDGTGPDFIILFGRTRAADWDFVAGDTPALNNVTQASLPLVFNFPNSNYLLSDEPYDFIILERDGEEDLELVFAAFDFPGTDPSSTYHIQGNSLGFGKNPNTGVGLLGFGGNGFLVFLNFELR